MQADHRRGKGVWSGCFTFKNIIYDGNQSTFSAARAGALMQGGRYWYCYRINDTTEAVNDSEDTSTDCPLLPGVLLNIFEVPSEIEDAAEKSSIQSGDSGYTLNPASKFEPLSPVESALESSPPSLTSDTSTSSNTDEAVVGKATPCKKFADIRGSPSITNHPADRRLYLLSASSDPHPLKQHPTSTKPWLHGSISQPTHLVKTCQIVAKLS